MSAAVQASERSSSDACLSLCAGTWLPRSNQGFPRLALFAEPAGRKIARIKRLLEEGGLVVGPELADVGIGLDHGVPEFVFFIAEHLLLFDLLDVDVVHGGEPIVERHR